MIITVVCDVLGEENNGTTIAAMNLIRALRKDHTVRVLCCGKDMQADENVFTVPSQNFGYVLNRLIGKVGVSLAKPDEEIIERAVDGADLVHIMLPFILGRHALRIARARGIPVTAGFHMQAENLTSYLNIDGVTGVNNAVYREIYSQFYQYVDAIHYPTAFIRRQFETAIGTSTPGYVISNGVAGSVRYIETEKPEEYRDRIVLLSIGRYAKEKDQSTLLKAVRLSKYKNSIQVILAGAGLQEKKLRRRGNRLPVPPVMGLFSREEIVRMLNYCDMYVHPAVTELEGIACLEALSVGKLVIVSDSEKSATKEFVSSDRCIFKAGDAQSLSGVIDWFIEHPEERRKIEEGYRNGPGRYDHDTCMRQMEEMMAEVKREHDARKQG